MDEQIAQESSEIPVQQPRKGRTKEQKIGRLKYMLEVLKDIKEDIHEVREIERIILNGLKSAGYFHYDIPLIQKFACEDAVDLDILQGIFEAGREGMLPRDVASQISEYKLARWNVSRRIVRMNKRLRYETGEMLFEKRGLKWALTRFAFEVWGSTKQEIEHNKADLEAGIEE